MLWPTRLFNLNQPPAAAMSPVIKKEMQFHLADGPHLIAVEARKINRN
jgi:hypothetical protein